jgi:hypothetical protein
MIRELSELIASLDFDEQGSLRLASARWTEAACELVLDIGLGDSAPHQAWTVRCPDVRAYRFSSGWADSANVLNDHVLLRPYTEPHVRLAFHGRSSDPYAVIGHLWDAHRQLLDSWYPFEEYLNPGMPLADLLAAGGGFLAEGPKSVMQGYALVLSSHKIESSFVAERPPVRWLDGAWQPESQALSVFLMGESYVIGAEFAAQRTTDEHLGTVA